MPFFRCCPILVSTVHRDGLLFVRVGFRLVPRFELLWLTDLFVNLPVMFTFAQIILFDSQPVFSTCRIGHVLSVTYLIRR